STACGTLAMAAALGMCCVAHAATVTTVGDTNNVATNTAFNSAGSLYNTVGQATGNNAFPEWSNGLAPSAGNDYVEQFLMRTPAANADQTFLGDSLAFIDGGQMRTKNTNNANTLTVNKLIVDGGNIAWNGNASVTLA